MPNKEGYTTEIDVCLKHVPTLQRRQFFPGSTSRCTPLAGWSRWSSPVTLTPTLCQSPHQIPHTEWCSKSLLLSGSEPSYWSCSVLERVSTMHHMLPSLQTCMCSCFLLLAVFQALHDRGTQTLQVSVMQLVFTTIKGHMSILTIPVSVIALESFSLGNSSSAIDLCRNSASWSLVQLTGSGFTSSVHQLPWYQP